MEQSSNKTIMCSVFFLDIVGYSKRSVAGQISLKERFNSYLSAAIRDVPMSDRIILDTGDGAAINFMGDVEDALKGALSMRASMLQEDPNIEPPLLVRMGINLGPVRLVRDINGQPNIVGDGINVAQRVMGFADASQILVSRSYFDAVSRLSPQYAGMFHYQGSRTDKHVREHEVYAIGYPGDKTTRPFAVHDGEEPQAVKKSKKFPQLMRQLNAVWASALSKLDAGLEFILTRYQAIPVRQRPLYVAVLGVPLVLLLVFFAKSMLREDPPAPPTPVVRAPRVLAPASGVSATASHAAVSGVAAGKTVAPNAKPQPEAKKLPSATSAKHEAEKKAEAKLHEANAPKKSKPVAENDKDGEKSFAAHGEGNANNKLLGFAKSDGSSNAKISLSCVPATLLFVDGVQRGRVSSGEVMVDVVPGRHVVIAILPDHKLFTQPIEVPAGKLVKVRPSVCGNE